MRLPSSSISRSSRTSGMTLLELTIVILVLMSLISILFIGAQAWKRGSDRTMCIMNIHTVQKAMRSYANLYGYGEGDSVAALRERLVGSGSYLENAPTCPGGGSYNYGEEFGTDTIPPVGDLYLSCSLAESGNHTPASHDDW